jgi:hypothetical protein
MFELIKNLLAFNVALTNKVKAATKYNEALALYTAKQRPVHADPISIPSG